MNTNQSRAAEIELEYDPDLRIAIVAARWNSEITDALLEGAIDELEGAGYNEEDYDVFRVPGTIELTFAARRLADTGDYDAVIILGCVIKGETPHFDFVCQSVTQGTTLINNDGKVPVIFGVVTTLNLQQALDRAGGKMGNKGAEAAQAALEMVAFNKTIDEPAG